MKKKLLKTSGEMDYDYENDIILFKATDRDYSVSLEYDDIVLDMDKEGFLTGIQIFDASKFFKLNKDQLLKIPKWTLNTAIHDGKAEVNLVFEVVVRNKIIEKNPIIIQSIRQGIPDCEMSCAA